MVKKITVSTRKRRDAARLSSFGSRDLGLRTPLRSNAAQLRHCSIYLAIARRRGWLALLGLTRGDA